MGLEIFRNYKFQKATPMAQAYWKRKYLFDTIASRFETGVLLLSMEESAASLDRERGRRTMTGFFRILHDADPTIVRRQRQGNGNAPRRRDATPAPAPAREVRRRARRPPQPPRARNRDVMIDGVRARDWARSNLWSGGGNTSEIAYEPTGRTGPGRMDGYE